MKQPLVYEVDLTKIQGKGDFPCLNCGINISPEDETEDVYSILEAKVRGETLEEIVIQCNNCGSRIHLVGFLSSILITPKLDACIQKKLSIPSFSEGAA